MACSIKQNLIDHLEVNRFAESAGEILRATRPAGEIMDEASRLSLLFNREYGTADLPFMYMNKDVVLNEDLISELELVLNDRNVAIVQPDDIAEYEGEVMTTMRAVIKKLGISESVVDSLRDSEGNKLEGVAAADILNRTISYLEGAESELPEEVVHFMVVAMKDLDDPLYRSMAKRIFSEPEYSEVKNDPNYQSLGYSEEDMIDEAITKVIINRLKKEVKEDRNTRWWKRFLDRVKHIFNMKKDPFSATLRKMLNDDLEVYADAISNTKRNTIFRSFGENFSQETIRETLLRKHNSLELVPFTKDALQGKIAEGTLEILEDETGAVFRYQHTDTKKIVTRRATDKSSIRFMRDIGGLDEYKKVTSQKRSKMLRENGTHLHDIGRQIMLNLAVSEFKDDFDVIDLGLDAPLKRAALQKESGLNAAQFKEFESAIRNILQSVKESNKEDGKVDLFAELRIFDPNTDTAGTIDMLFVLPNGSAQVYDFKFISPKEKDIKRTSAGTPYLIVDPFRGSKGMGYEDQMSFYVSTLMREYGISNITKSRIIPGHVRFKWNKSKKEYEGISYLSMGFNGDRFLMQYPLAKEMSEDSKLNDDLRKLYDKLDELKKKKDTPSVRRERNFAVTAIKDLLNDSDMRFTVAEISSLLKYTSDIMKEPNKDDPSYFEDLRSIYELLGTFSNIEDIAKERIKKAKKKNKEKGEKLEVSLEKASEDVRASMALIDSELKGILSKTSKFNYGDKAFYSFPSLPVTWKDNFLSMNMVDSMIFKDAFDRILEARSRADEKYREHYRKWKKLDDDLKEWAGSRSIREVYDMLIRETEVGLKLVTMFRPSFREEIDSMISEAFASEDPSVKNSAIKFMKENFQIKEGAKEEFEKFKEDYLKQKEREWSGKTTDQYKAAEEYFNKTYNVFSRPEAWASPKYYRFLELKPEIAEQNYSEEYRVITAPGNEALLNYYNAWKEQMKEFSQMSEGKSFSYDMIPSINKGIMEGIMTGENVFDSVSKNIMKGLTVEVENEENVGKGGSRSIPLKFTQAPRTKNGEVDTTLISRDLTKAMVTFGAHFYEYAEESAIESQLLYLRHMLFNDPEVVQAQKVSGGKLRREAGRLYTKEVDESTKQLFDTFLDLILYKNVGTAGGEITIGGKNISSEKLLGAMMNVFSKTTLTLPVKAALATTGSSTLFRVAKSVDNPNYSYELLSKSHKMFWSDRKRYMAISEYFDVHQEGDRVFHERELSGDLITRYADSSYMYYPLIPADKINDRRLLVAMLHNHAVDENGLIQRLEDMPEGTKPLAETMEVSEDGKITKELPQSVRHQIKMRFLGEVKGIRGDMSNASVAAYQANIFFKALMQFKSWMPPMVQDRFGSVGYDIYTGKYTTGRYAATFQGATLSSDDQIEELAWHEMGINALKSMKSLITTLTMLDDYALSEKEKANSKNWNEAKEARYQRRRKKYMKQWKFIKENSTDPRLVNMPIEKFYELQQMAVRSTLAEIRGILMLMLLSLAFGWKGDDDKEWYKDQWATRKMHDLLARVILESAMFINPAELAKLNKSAIPMLGMLDNLIKVFVNSADETVDLFTGEMFEKGDRAQAFYYTGKFLPGMNFVRWVSDINKE